MVPGWMQVQLGSCGFTGPLPRSLASLPVVNFMDLSANSLSGEVAPFTSPTLSSLLLQSNLLTAALPGALDFLSSLTSLLHLDLSDNPLGCDVGAALAGLANAQYTVSQRSNCGQAGALYGSLITLRVANASLTYVGGGGGGRGGPLSPAPTRACHTRMLVATHACSLPCTDCD